jgi:hypothetical protein
MRRNLQDALEDDQPPCSHRKAKGSPGTNVSIAVAAHDALQHVVHADAFAAFSARFLHLRLEMQ